MRALGALAIVLFVASLAACTVGPSDDATPPPSELVSAEVDAGGPSDIVVVASPEPLLSRARVEASIRARGR